MQLRLFNICKVLEISPPENTNLYTLYQNAVAYSPNGSERAKFE
jgi:hypothetical protein